MLLGPVLRSFARLAGTGEAPGSLPLTMIVPTRSDVTPSCGAVVGSAGRLIGLFLLAGVCGSQAAAPQPAQGQATDGGTLEAGMVDGLVTLRADRVSIAEIFAALARHAPLVVVAQAPLDQRVTLDVRRIPLAQAVRRLLRTQSFVLHQPKGSVRGTRPVLIWVYPSADSPPVTSAAAVEIRSPNRRARHDPHAGVRSAGLVGPGKPPGDAAVAGLGSALDDARAGVRHAAIESLGQDSSTPAIELIAQALGDADPGVRRAAVDALGDAGSAAAATALGVAVHDSDPTVRHAVAEILGELGGAEAEALLHQMLGDRDAEVRRTAGRVLAERTSRQPRR